MLAFNSDYALYAMGLEQVKTAFRCAYSLLDKVAYFVNDYWQLGISEEKVNFRSVWVEVPKGKGRQKCKFVKSLILQRACHLEACSGLQKTYITTGFAMWRTRARKT